MCTSLQNSVLVFFRILGQRPSAKAKCSCEVPALEHGRNRWLRIQTKCHWSLMSSFQLVKVDDCQLYHFPSPSGLGYVAQSEWLLKKITTLFIGIFGSKEQNENYWFYLTPHRYWFLWTLSKLAPTKQSSSSKSTSNSSRNCDAKFDVYEKGNNNHGAILKLMQFSFPYSMQKKVFFFNHSNHFWINLFLWHHHLITIYSLVLWQ